MSGHHVAWARAMEAGAQAEGHCREALAVGMRLALLSFPGGAISAFRRLFKGTLMNSTVRTVLIIVLILLLLGALPLWPYSAGWGYFPSGGLGLVVLIIIILLVTGRL